jgi:hypothetical protein
MCAHNNTIHYYMFSLNLRMQAGQMYESLKLMLALNVCAIKDMINKL